MYDIRLINPLHQHGVREWTLVFSDSDGEVPSVRVEKKYPEDWSEVQIRDDVRNTLEAMTAVEVAEGEMSIRLDLAGETLLVDQIGGEVAEWLL